MQRAMRFVTVLTICLFFCGASGARVRAASAPSLVGTWKVTVTPDGSPVGFVAYNAFHSDGTSIEFDTGNSPSLQTVATGPWIQLSGREFAFTEYNVVFGRNGRATATAEVTARLTLSDDGNSFTSRFVLQLLDDEGNPIGGPITGTAAGTRVTVNLTALASIS